MKNRGAELAGAGVPHEVSGILLYERTDKDVQPDGAYQMSGNQVSVRTLDLNQPFDRPQSFVRLFDRKRQMLLVGIIRRIKENALNPAA